MQYYCEKCQKYWMYPVEKCIFCSGTIFQKEETKYRVVGYSEILIPSAGNERVPYYVNLLEDENNQKIIRKSFIKYQIGDFFSFERDIHQNVIIGIIGAGLLGIQLSVYMLLFGFLTILKTRDENTKENSVQKIRKLLSKKCDEDEVTYFIKNLTITTRYSDLNQCDIIIEAVAEDIAIKKEVFYELSQVCPKTTIFATNSSSLSIDEIAQEIPNPDRCIGMHFFNPIQKMDLVEVVIGQKTSAFTKKTIVAFAANLNKKPIIVKNSPGYIVNRLLLPQINEAILLFEEGIATKEDIDSAVKLGLNHPMGPFELADFIGLDICYNILDILHNNFKNPKYKPANLLHEKVTKGKLGYKTGEGFYTYGNQKDPQIASSK
jgi:3-hydroxybutyryl-CoA dehydrogenase